VCCNFICTLSSDDTHRHLEIMLRAFWWLLKLKIPFGIITSDSLDEGVCNSWIEFQIMRLICILLFGVLIWHSIYIFPTRLRMAYFYVISKIFSIYPKKWPPTERHLKNEDATICVDFVSLKVVPLSQWTLKRYMHERWKNIGKLPDRDSGHIGCKQHAVHCAVWEWEKFFFRPKYLFLIALTTRANKKVLQSCKYFVYFRFEGNFMDELKFRNSLKIYCWLGRNYEKTI
jgi:hypothetical protein